MAIAGLWRLLYRSMICAVVSAVGAQAAVAADGDPGLGAAKAAFDAAGQGVPDDAYTRAATDYILQLADVGQRDEAVKVFSAMYVRTTPNIPYVEADASTGFMVLKVINGVMGGTSDPKTALLDSLVKSMFERQIPPQTDHFRFDLLAPMALTLMSDRRFDDAKPYVDRLLKDDYVLPGNEKNTFLFSAFVRMMNIAQLTRDGRDQEALLELELVRGYVFETSDMRKGKPLAPPSETPGEGFFNAQFAIAFNAYWPLRAVLAGRAGVLDDVEYITGSKSKLHPYWKAYVKAESLARQGDFAGADSTLAGAEALFDDGVISRSWAQKVDANSRQRYSHHALACEVRVKLKAWSQAEESCTKALAAQQQFRNVTVPFNFKEPLWGIWLLAIGDIAPAQWMPKQPLGVTLSIVQQEVQKLAAQ